MFNFDAYAVAKAAITSAKQKADNESIWNERILTRKKNDFNDAERKLIKSGNDDIMINYYLTNILTPMFNKAIIVSGLFDAAKDIVPRNLSAIQKQSARAAATSLILGTKISKSSCYNYTKLAQWKEQIKSFIHVMCLYTNKIHFVRPRSINVFLELVKFLENYRNFCSKNCCVLFKKPANFRQQQEKVNQIQEFKPLYFSLGTEQDSEFYEGLTLSFKLLANCLVLLLQNKVKKEGFPLMPECLVSEHSKQRNHEIIQKDKEKRKEKAAQLSVLQVPKIPIPDPDMLLLWRLMQWDWKKQKKKKQTEKIKAFGKWKNDIKSKIKKDFEEKTSAQKRKFEQEIVEINREFEQEIVKIKRELEDNIIEFDLFIDNCSCQEPPRKRQRQCHNHD